MKANMKISELTPGQQVQIAAKIAAATGRPTTANSLRHVVKGRVGVQSGMAIAIERAAAELGLDLRREDMSTACGECEFAKACRSTKQA